MAKIRRKWLTSNPLVINQINAVDHNQKRNITYLPNHQRTKQPSAMKEEWKKIKREKTEQKQSHFDDV